MLKTPRPAHQSLGRLPGIIPAICLAFVCGTQLDVGNVGYAEPLPAETARELFQAGDFPAAKSLLAQLLANEVNGQLLDRYLEACRACGTLTDASGFIQSRLATASDKPLLLMALGRVRSWQGDCQGAWESYHRALEAAPTRACVYFEHIRCLKDCRDREQELGWLNDFAIRRPEAGPWAAAARAMILAGARQFERASALADSVLASVPQHPLALLALAEVLSQGNRLEEAIAIYRRARACLFTAEDSRLAEQCIVGIANCLNFLGSNQEVLALMDSLVAVHADEGDRIGEALARRRDALALAETGDYPGALAMAERSLALITGMGDRRLEMVIQDEIGRARFLVGDYRAAIGALETSVNMAESLDEVEHGLQASNNLATTLAVLGDYTESDRLLLRNLARYQERQDRWGELFCQSGLGFNRMEQGDLTEALRRLHLALNCASETGDQDALQTQLVALGQLYMELGETARAQHYLERALVVAQNLQHPGKIAECETALSRLAMLRGDLDDALARIRRSMPLLRGIEDDEGLAAAHLGAARVFLQMERPDSAAHHARIGTDMSSRDGFSLGEGFGRLALAGALIAAGNAAEGSSEANTARAIGDRLDARPLVWQAEAAMGEAEAAQLHWAAAREHYDAAMSELENVNRSLVLENYRYRFRASKQDVYERAIAASLTGAEAGRSSQPGQAEVRAAYGIVERSRAQALRDELVTEGLERAILLDAPPELRRQEETLLDRIKALHRCLWEENPQGETRDRLERELMGMENDRDRLALTCRQLSPSYARLRWPASLQATQVQQEVLEAGDLLLEYFVGSDQSWLWAVTPDALDLIELPPAAELTTLVDMVLTGLAKPPSSQPPNQAALARLSGLLLGGAAEKIAAAARLLIIQDGSLLRIPFETLIFGGTPQSPKYLIEAAPIVYLPSASTAPLLDRSVGAASTEPLTILAFGLCAESGRISVPSVVASAVRGLATANSAIDEADRANDLAGLPFARQEIEGIAELIPQTVHLLLSDTAGERAFKDQNLGDYNILHLATHALVDCEHPGRSCILLGASDGGGEDGYLWLQEIYELPLHAQLVVLSACRGAAGEVIPGEGVLSLARAFLHAGAASVLASLWPVSDRSTCTWMRKFYQEVAAGITFGQAAREAKLAFLHGGSPALRHPYYWAPFILIGKDR